MFFTEDNSGYIRISYTTDIDMAEAINMLIKGMKTDGSDQSKPPLISHPGIMGGYRMPILEKIAGGNNFQVLKCSLPGDDSALQKLLWRTIEDPNTLYEYVENTTVTIVQVEGWDNTKAGLRDLGWEVRSSQKTFKRFKTLNRPFRFWSNPDRQLRVYVVDDLDYASDDLGDDLSDDMAERLLDGGFVISSEIQRECIANIEFPELVDGELNANGLRAAAFRRQANHWKTFNARIFGKFEYSGSGATEDFIQRKGMLKGQAFVDVSDTCAKMNVDIICARSALKTEVASSDTFVLLDPQLAKYHVTGDLQSITHNPALFDPDDVKSWMHTMLMSAFEDLKSDKLMEHWYRIGSPEFDTENNIKYDQNDLINLTKWNARAWIMSGMSLKQSPWLFEQMAKNIVSIIKTTDIKKMRVPIPCSVRAQVISSSMSAAAGEDINVPVGCLRWNEAHQVMVVNDADWLEMYESHGGMDLDDFFVGYWRTRGDRKVVFITRSPNDFGEYSMFDYVEGDWYPTFELHDGSIMEFPEVSDNPDHYPKRLSEAVRDRDVIYEGLPSASSEKHSTGNEWYGIADVRFAIGNNKDSQASVGAAVNARSLWSLTKGCHRPVQLVPMETCIDTGVQGGCVEDIDAVRAEAQTIVNEIISDPTLKVDGYLWQTRFQSMYKGKMPHTRLTSDTHVSKIHRHRIAFAKYFVTMSSEYVTNNVGVNVDPVIHELGKRFYRKGIEFLRYSRQSLRQARLEGGETTEAHFKRTHDYILAQIDKLPRINDRHDMIMAIYSACLKIPVSSTGRLSDQLVMNPAFFDRLMAALRFYGIASYLVIDENGRIRRHKDDSWILKCNGCSFTLTTTDPKFVQSYHYYDGYCDKCHNS